jgi:hypothetical protein
MAENQAHAGNGPEELSGSKERTAEDVMRDDVAPATSVLRDALRSCASLIGDSAQIARNTDLMPQTQTDAALAAARLGATAAQIMGALARAADADTRMRIASMRLENSDRQRANARRSAPVRREAEYRPRRDHDEDGLYNPDLADD